MHKILITIRLITLTITFPIFSMVETLYQLTDTLATLKTTLIKPTQRELGDALYKKDISTLRSLLQKGANPNTIYTPFGGTSRTPFIDAIETLNLEIIKLFIEFKADVNINIPSDDYPLYTPLDFATNQILGWFAFYKPDPVTPKDIAIIKLLLSNGAKISITTLQRALHRNNEELMSLLLNTLNKEERQHLLDQAIKACDSQVTALLITKGATVSPMHLFDAVNCFLDDYAILKLLLNKKLNINVQNKEGKTPLMEAALKFRTEAVDLLLKKGADATIIDNKGKTALDYAANTDIENLLRNAMKKK